MARPLTARRVEAGLQECMFRPAGPSARGREPVVLHMDELEAVRLADLNGMYHEEAARRMGVSRQTFGRILESARHGIADAIINRRCLRIVDGGSVKLAGHQAARGPADRSGMSRKMQGGRHGAHR
jgi:uncharacterized protein